MIELQKRKRVGGILDRRFGENNPTLTPEEKAIERFVKEKQRASKKHAIFDLEVQDEEEGLTHLGQSLDFKSNPQLDDFAENELSDTSMENDDGTGSERQRKRRRLSPSDSPLSTSIGREEEDLEQQRPKTKNEVMKEVIQKSKLHKYERQQAKEDDDDLRAELDKGLPDLYALMRGKPSIDSRARASTPPRTTQDGIHPQRLALLDGRSRTQADKEYDERLRQMALDLRAKPSSRTLTEEEKAQQEAARLQELEEKRLRRMRGESIDSDPSSQDNVQAGEDGFDDGIESHDAFGLGEGLRGLYGNASVNVEDEDEFLIEDDFVANGSENSITYEDGSSVPDDDDDESDKMDDEAEFVENILSIRDAETPGLPATNGSSKSGQIRDIADSLAYTYPCPSSHHELLGIVKDLSLEQLPIVIQRIRALYAPQLASENKAKLGKFSEILVEHISYLAKGMHTGLAPVLESLIRHVHSLSKTFPDHVGNAFRSRLREIHEERSGSLTTGDLMILTAIGSIFSTSDHFHQVVTPAMLCMTRYLEQHIPGSRTELLTGLYVCTLCLHYQKMSKRYIPEVLNYLVNAVYALLPVKPEEFPLTVPMHKLSDKLRLQVGKDTPRLDDQDNLLPCFWSMTAKELSDQKEEALKLSMLAASMDLFGHAADLWFQKSAFYEAFNPICELVQFMASEKCKDKLSIALRAKAQTLCEKIQPMLARSTEARKPLRLHSHRPMAIKTFVPKFEEDYNPGRHYDHDRDRAELSKLKAEHKKERKGALRELRKDANFLARESLREKREKDVAYEKKYRRLVAEIQGEEGHEAKMYEKEKRLRKNRK